jgi:hypothetical protein
MFSSNTTQVSSGGYEIQRSLRFNSADTAFLNRTPSTATNRKTWTFSAWIKRSGLGGSNNAVISAGTAGNPRGLVYFTNDQFGFYQNSIGSEMFALSAAVFRDPSAWYHCVVAFDSTQSTDTNRIKIYVNSVQQTISSGAIWPVQNSDSVFNANIDHFIGAYIGGAHFPGYMTEVNFIDGQALTPSSFGEINADTGVWQPKPYAGSYGTNGFYLNFSNNSNTTAATLGADYSGNGNNWTPNNFSVSAGAGNDSLVDVPTNWGSDSGVGGTVRGNYCTLNPLSNPGASTLSNGNLDCVTSAGNTGRVVGTTSMSSGKWYWEYSKTAANTYNLLGGIAPDYEFTSAEPGRTAASYGYYGGTGQKYNNATLTSYGSSYTNGDIIGVALDMDAGTLTFYKNGVSQGVAFSGLTGSFVPAISAENASSISLSVNFGQRPFAYTAPSGFKALNTQNLPTPTIGATPTTQAGKFFNPVLWTGNGANNRAVTGVGFQPDFVWAKSRSAATSNVLNDVIRGGSRTLFSNTTEAEYYDPDAFVQSFTSDGFTVGQLGGVNENTSTYVAWNWKANGAGVTNTAGSITSTVSANTTSGFSVVNALMNTGTNQSVGHGLGARPAMVILKNRAISDDWYVWHQSFTNQTDSFLRLNTTAAVSDIPGLWGSGMTSTVIGVRPSSFVTASQNVIMYAFAEVPGYSRFGSYTGNGSTDGPFVFCGFRPAYVLIKASSIANDWVVFDDARNTSNAATQGLYPNLNIAEQSFAGIDILSNGFKLRNSTQLANQSGTTYIFAAFAEFPQKFSLAR